MVAAAARFAEADCPVASTGSAASSTPFPATCTSYASCATSPDQQRARSTPCPATCTSGASCATSPDQRRARSTSSASSASPDQRPARGTRAGTGNAAANRGEPGVQIWPALERPQGVFLRRLHARLSRKTVLVHSGKQIRGEHACGYTLGIGLLHYGNLRFLNYGP